ncbi:hypothetical protein LCGC14_1943870 [marine sediment metagenome]|uniref:Uncharacterized protein n=1 Tax=marine sediment metagenome TaxID=412755 RepID=A0A0F9G7X3_9ZZZZ
MDTLLTNQVIGWHLSNGGFCPVQEQKYHALRLLHEAVELCLATGADKYETTAVVQDEVVKHMERHGSTTAINLASVWEEIADVAILLEIFVYYTDVAIDNVVRDKLDVLYERKWKADEHGVLWRDKTTEQGGTP